MADFPVGARVRIGQSEGEVVGNRHVVLVRLDGVCEAGRFNPKFVHLVDEPLPEWERELLEKQQADQAVADVVDTDLRNRIVKAIMCEDMQSDVRAQREPDYDGPNARADAVMAELAPVLAERDRYRREVKALRREVDEASVALAAAKDWKWERPPTLKDRVELVASELDIARRNVEKLVRERDALKTNPVLVWLPEFGDDEEIQLDHPVVHNRADGRFVLRAAKPWTEFKGGDRATATDLDGRTVTGRILHFLAWDQELGRNSRAKMQLENGQTVVHSQSLRPVEDQPGGGS